MDQLFAKAILVRETAPKVNSATMADGFMSYRLQGVAKIFFSTQFHMRRIVKAAVHAAKPEKGGGCPGLAQSVVAEGKGRPRDPPVSQGVGCYADGGGGDGKAHMTNLEVLHRWSIKPY
jgi:hypothetical protein